MKNVSAIIFLLVSLFHFEKAIAQDFSITSTPSPPGLTMCGTEGKFYVDIQNISGVDLSSRTLTLSFSETGIFVTSFGTNSSTVTFTPDPADHAAQVMIDIQSLLAGETLHLSLKAAASCNVNIGTNASIPASLLIKEGAQVLHTSPFTLYKSENGSIISQINAQQVQDLTERIFVLQNTSAPFNGFFTFNDVSGSAVHIDQIELTYTNSSGVQTDIIQNGVEVSLNDVAVNSQIIIKEKISIVECVNSSNGISNITFSSGCFSNEACSVISYSTILGNLNLSPQITLGANNSASYQTCFGDDNFTTREYVFTNTGTGTTRNFGASFLPASGYLVDPTSFEIEILDASMNIISGGPFEVEASDIVTNIVFTYDYVNPYNNNNEYGALSQYRDIVLATSQWPGFEQNSSCSSPSTVFSRVIRKYRDATSGQVTSIVLRPGESMRVRWRDKSCCLKPAVFQPGSRLTNPIFRLFSEDCQNNMATIGSTFNYDYNDVKQQVGVYTPMLNGNPDNCWDSRDGQIGDYSIFLKGGRINSYTLKQDMSQWGDLVVELDLQDGLDLDLSLNGTAVQGNSLCNTANCATCSPTLPLWSATDPGRFNIAYMPTNSNNYVWVPSQVVLVSSVPSAKKVYQVHFRLADLMQVSGIMTHPGYNPGYNREYLNDLLNNLRLDFSLKSFCTNVPESVIAQTVYYQPQCTEGCMMWLSEALMKIAVTCPGCITPGGNITAYSILRDQDFLGQRDELNEQGDPFSDRAPDGTGLITDPLLMANCTNGDLMHCNFTVVLSNGQNGTPANPTPGYELNVLASKNIFLDNLYVDITPGSISSGSSVGNMILPEDVNAVEVSIDGGVTWHLVLRPLVVVGSNFFVHIKASDLGLPNNNFHSSVSASINVRIPFRVNRDISATGDRVKPIFVRSEPDFSDCDNCLSADGLIFPGGDASNIMCDWTQVGNECPLISADAKYYCQSGLTMINFIPTITSYNKGMPHITTCDKLIQCQLAASPAEGGDAFRHEYRTFIEESETVPFEVSIPVGYSLSGISIQSLSSMYPISDVYYLSEAELANAISSNLITVSGQSVTIDVRLKEIAENDFSFSIYEPYTGQALRIYDDYLNLIVNVNYKVNDCPMNTVQSIYADSQSDLFCTPPFPYQLVENPTVTVPELPTLDAGTYPILYYGYKYMVSNDPHTKYEGQAVTIANQSGGLYYIPVSFDNLDPVDASGNSYFDCLNNNAKLGSQNAENPFIYITNLTDLTANGFSVVGVYEGNVNSSVPSSGNFYNSTTGVASLMRSGQKYIPANTIQNRYTVVLRYTCPAGCDPLLASCTTSDDFLPACIAEDDFVNLSYGWNCDGYPTSAEEVTGACFVDELNPVRLEKEAVAINVSSDLNGGNPVTFCDEFDYKVSLASCRQGGTSDLDLTLVLPSSVEYVSHTTVYDGASWTAAAVLSPNTVTVDNLINTSDVDGLTNVQAVEVTFRLKWKNVSASVQNTLSATFAGTTYCGTTYSRTLSNTIPSGVVIVDNIQPDYCITNPPVVFTALMPGGVFASTGNGLTDHANGTATFEPAVAGLGTYTITYTINNCVASYQVIVRPGPVVAIVATPSTRICDVNVTLTSNPATFISYSWTKGTEAAILSSTSTLSVNTAGTYYLNVTESVGCTGTASIDITKPAVTLDHPGGCFSETTVLSPVTTGISSTATYQWYKDGVAISPNGDQLNYTATASGEYYLVITDGICVLTSETVTLYLSPEVYITLPNDGGVGFYCGENAAVELTAHGSGGSGVLSYSWTGPGLTTTTGQVVTASQSGTYEVTVTDGNCTATDDQTITVGYEYQIGDVNWVCGSTNKNICVPVNAVVPVRNGIIGMDFCLKYDKRYVTPVTTVSNSNLGGVVLGSGFPGTYATSVNVSPSVESDPNIGYVQVSIYYQSNSPGAQFAGSGLVICVPFTVTGAAGTLVAGNGFDFTMCEMYESYTLNERPVCWGGGSFNVVNTSTFNGQLEYYQPYGVGIAGYMYRPLNHDLGVTYHATNSVAVRDQCNGNLLGEYNGITTTSYFSVPISAATNVITIKRDINNIVPLTALNYVNARDTRAIEFITTRNTTACVQQTILSSCPNVFVPTPGQMIAADVNMSDSVRANDITLLQRRMINVINEYPQVPNLVGKPSVDWRFIDPDLTASSPDFVVSANYPFSDGAVHYWRDNVPNVSECLSITPQCENSPRKKFRGILLGDVINYSSPYTSNAYLRTGGANVVSPFTYTVDLYASIKINDIEYDVPVYYTTPDTAVAYAFDFGLEYNADSVTITDMDEAPAITASGSRLMWNDDIGYSTLRSTNYTPATWSTGGVCYYLRVRKYSGEELTTADIKGGYGMINGDWANVVVLGKSSVTTSVFSPDGLVNDIRVVPSPVVSESGIEYWLSQYNSESNIVVTNLLGQVVLKYQNLTSNGRISISSASLEKGVYFCTLNDMATSRSKTVKFVVE